MILTLPLFSLSLDLARKGKNEGAAQGKLCRPGSPIQSYVAWHRCGHLGPVLTSVNNEKISKERGRTPRSENLCMVKQCWPLFKEMGRLEIYHWSFCFIEFVF